MDALLSGENVAILFPFLIRAKLELDLRHSDRLAAIGDGVRTAKVFL